MRRRFLIFSATSCDQVDKAFEAVDKAKNLKTEFEKKTDEVKKDIAGKAEEFGEKVKRSADNLGGKSGKDDKGSEDTEKPRKEGKERKEYKSEKN